MQLECQICFNPYDFGEHRPKVLSCGHTYCQDCLKKIKDCSLDRRPIDRAALVDNYEMLRLLESIHEQNAVQTANGVPVQNSTPINQSLCWQHKEPRKFFCLKDNVEVCDKCVIFGQHKDHQSQILTLIELQERNKKVKESFRNSSKLIRSLQTSFNKQRILDEQTREIDKQKVDLLEKIELEFSEFLEDVSEAKSKLLEEIESIFAISRKSAEKFLSKKHEQVQQWQMLLLNTENFLQQESGQQPNEYSAIARDLGQAENLLDQHKSFQKKLEAIDLENVAESLAQKINAKLSWLIEKRRIFDSHPTKLVMNKIDFFEFNANQFDKRSPTNIIVRRFDKNVNEENIKSIFGVCGPIEKVKMNTDDKGNFVGSCSLKFKDENLAKRALFMDGLKVGRGIWTVEYDVLAEDEESQDLTGRSYRIKKKKDIVRKYEHIHNSVNRINYEKD